jgi:hypothetical protein
MSLRLSIVILHIIPSLAFPPMAEKDATARLRRAVKGQLIFFLEACDRRVLIDLCNRK